MKSIWVVALAAAIGLGINIEQAEAKRLGGGASFGSKPSQSQPMQRDSVAPAKSDKAQQGQPAQPAAAGNPAAATRPGMGGMLGGLLAGGLLAALFFGGAFENINFADILIVGLLAFVAFKLFKSFAARRAPMPAAAGGVPHAPAGYGESTMARDNAASASTARASAVGGGHADAASASAVHRRAQTLPAGFDERAFLTEAKARYEQLQAAWDSGDLGTLRQFSSDKVFGEIQDLYRARRGENRTELKRVDASLIDVVDHSDAVEVSVLFDVSMIEHDADAPLMPQATDVTEVWHFVRSKRAMRPEWILDGIQQVE